MTDLLLLINKNFVKLTLAAFLIACPITWYTMQLWLKNFAYHIELKWWVFALAGASRLVIAVLTVSYQALRAALANPVEALKTE